MPCMFIKYSVLVSAEVFQSKQKPRMETLICMPGKTILYNLGFEEFRSYLVSLVEILQQFRLLKILKNSQKADDFRYLKVT